MIFMIFTDFLFLRKTLFGLTKRRLRSLIQPFLTNNDLINQLPKFRQLQILE